MLLPEPIDPLITPFFQYGVTVSAAVIATGLFIWSQIRSRSQEEVLRSQARLLEQFAATLAKISETQSTIAGVNRTIADSVAILTRATGSLSAEHHELLMQLNTLIQENKVLANSQIGLISGLQRVIEQLVGALKE